MLANLRRKVGMHPGIAAPIQNLPPPLLPEGMVGPYVERHSVGPPPLTMEELGFSWPGDRGMVNPSTIPTWIQEQVCESPLHRWNSSNCLTKLHLEPHGPWPPRQRF